MKIRHQERGLSRDSYKKEKMKARVHLDCFYISEKQVQVEKYLIQNSPRWMNRFHSGKTHRVRLGYGNAKNNWNLKKAIMKAMTLTNKKFYGILSPWVIAWVKVKRRRWIPKAAIMIHSIAEPRGSRLAGIALATIILLQMVLYWNFQVDFPWNELCKLDSRSGFRSS